MIECYLKNTEVETDEYSKDNIDMAENAFLKFLDWEKKHDYELIHSELQLVSDVYNFGGTIDSYYKDENNFILIDFKTGKGIYSEMETQVAGYKLLLEEHGDKVDECYILRIGRTLNEGFEYKKIENIKLHEERFMMCLKLYELNKAIRK